MHVCVCVCGLGGGGDHPGVKGPEGLAGVKGFKPTLKKKNRVNN